MDGKSQCQTNLVLCKMNRGNGDAAMASESNVLGSYGAGDAIVVRDDRPQLSNDPSLAKRDPISPCTRHRGCRAMQVVRNREVVARLAEVDECLRI